MGGIFDTQGRLLRALRNEGCMRRRAVSELSRKIGREKISSLQWLATGLRVPRRGSLCGCDADLHTYSSSHYREWWGRGAGGGGVVFRGKAKVPKNLSFRFVEACAEGSDPPLPSERRGQVSVGRYSPSVCFVSCFDGRCLSTCRCSTIAVIVPLFPPRAHSMDGVCGCDGTVKQPFASLGC